MKRRKQVGKTIMRTTSTILKNWSSSMVHSLCRIVIFRGFEGLISPNLERETRSHLKAGWFVFNVTLYWWILWYSCWGWRCRPWRRWTRTWCKLAARLSKLWLPENNFWIIEKKDQDKLDRYIQFLMAKQHIQHCYNTIYLGFPTLRRQFYKIIVIHLERWKCLKQKHCFVISKL